MSHLRSIALQHLRLLQVEQKPDQDRLYVGLAFQYGVTVPEIAEASGIPLARVQQILGEM